MSKSFISVPVKLLILITGTLLIIGIGFSILSIQRLDQEIKDFQQNKRQQGQQQLLLHHQLYTSELSTWLESFSGMIGLANQDDFSNLTASLQNQVDALQLNFNVDNVWLFNNESDVLFSTSDVPDFIVKQAQNVAQKQTPLSTIYCTEQCQQLVVVPLLNKNADMAVVALSSTLVNVIYGIKETLKSEVAVINFPLNADPLLSQGHFISSSNNALTNAVFAGLKNKHLQDVLENGVRSEFSSEKYFLTMFPLSNSESKQYYLVLVDDISAFVHERDKYRVQFILSIIIIFLILGGISYRLSSPFTKRLLKLSEALPLLYQKKFDEFRTVKLTPNRFFSDELDILVHSANDVSFELERLNLAVEQKTRELENIAMYDLLTGLPNRNMLNFQLRKALEKLRSSKTSVAVMFLDLDDFKKVNDSHGHAEGDDLLIEAAKRLKGCVQKIDLVCRFGGDEFVIVLEEISDISQATQIANDILEAFKQPIAIGSSLFYVSTSIGITHTDNPDIHAADLIRQSDIAMYEAKDAGGASYHIYHAEMFKRVAQRVMIESEVRQALAKNQFSLSLQPQIAAQNYQVIGFEALLRWHHPERGMVAPDDFIPVLENSAYMVELGYWVIRHCFELMQKLVKVDGLSHIRIAINLSAIQFVDPKLIGFLQDLLLEFSLEAKQFELEITEQTVVKDVNHAVAVMHQLREIGFSFAIDDFGTGYSSLSYLKNMPLDIIKIDKSFVDGMLENHADYQIIMSTVNMVKNLGLCVVAEGVESSAQLHSLRQHECDLIQGYYFSKPIPENELISCLKQKTLNGFWKSEIQKSTTFTPQ
jgi:diguanylate cyclase (GGDEF)-like protein